MNNEKKSGKGIEIRVFDYNNVELPEASVEITIGDRTETLTYNTTAGVFESPAGEEEIEILVSAPGLETQSRRIKPKEGKSEEIFLLGREEMPYFYRGKVKVPFEPVPHTYGLFFKPDPEQKKSPLGRLVKNLRIHPLREEKQNGRSQFVLFEFPGDLAESDRKEVLRSLESEAEVMAAKPVLKMSGESAIFLSDEIIVRFKSEVAEEEANALAEEFGLVEIRRIPYIPNAFHYRYPGGADFRILDICNQLTESGLVEYAEPNVYSTVEQDAVTPNNYLYPEQWDHPIIRMPDAWQLVHNKLSSAEQFGSPDIIIAVCDDGVDTNHPQFSGNISNGQTKLFSAFDFGTMVPNTNGLQGTHGTRCASAATGYTSASSGPAGAPADGSVGIAPNCRLIAAITPGTEADFSDMYIWIAGFDPGSPTAGFPAPLARGADVISNSFGFSTGVPISGLMSDTFDFLTSYGRNGKGVVLMFSAGNQGGGGCTGADATLLRPWGSYSKCMSISASTLANDGATEVLADYSNFGPRVSFCAPSSDACTGTHNPPTSYGAFTGTVLNTNAIVIPNGNTPRNRQVQTTINGAVLAGSNSITVASTAGMANGQAVYIGNPSANISTSEAHVITGIAGNVISFTPAVLFNDHGHGTPVHYGLRDYVNNFGGTSYATPVIAGIAALMLSVNKNLTWIEVREILRNTAIKIDPANVTANGRWRDVNNVAFGSAGYITPYHSQYYGFGRVDAAAAVSAAINFNHDQRDLIIRDYLGDDGKAATDPDENPVKSPDIWTIDGAAVAGPLMHGVAGQTPANVNTSGDTLNTKPKRSAANTNVFARFINRGSGDPANPLPGNGDPAAPPAPFPALNYSLDHEANIFLALKDTDIAVPLLKDDYIDGPTLARVNIRNYAPLTPAAPTPLSTGFFDLNNNTGNGVVPGTRLLQNFKSTSAAPASQIPAGKARIHVGNLAKADRPRLPFPFVMVRTTAQVNAADSTINVEHTRGFANGQQILVGRPSDPNYRAATINAAPGLTSIQINGTAGNVYPAGTVIIRLENVSTTLASAAPAAAAGAKFSVLDVNSVAGFKIGNHIMSGAVPSAANNKFHRIVRIVRNTSPAVNQLVIEPPLGAGGLASGTLLTQLAGRVKAYVLAEVTPYDGLLADATPEDNNNLSYREINFGHDILFRDTTGGLDLSKRIQVAKSGTDLTTNFRVYVRDGDVFSTESVVITVTRKLKNGNYESASYRYKTTAPAAWEIIPSVPAWLGFTAPKLSSTNAAAAGNQTDIYFEGNFKANKDIDEIAITVNVAGNDPHPLGAKDFISTETYTARVFTVTDLPDITDPDLQEQTGMPALAGTQTLHAFADMTSVEQPQALAFGPKSDTQFRLTSSFNTNATPAATVNAYAVIDGIVFIQRNTGSNTINLVIKPLKQAEIGFNRVKYFIYRGIKEEDFFTSAQPDRLLTNPSPNPAAHFVDSVIATQNLLNPGQPVYLTALGWDPANQAAGDSLDDFFFNSNPNRQLPVVKRGMTLGRFKNSDIGFEIVLAEGAYPISLANLRLSQYTLDVSTITNADERAAKREEILNYVDPAAYYGMHYLSGILYPTLPDPDPAAINTGRKDTTQLYDTVIAKFFTRNTLYIDVRNENGYSYNYYGNYTQRTGSDLGKAIRTGYIPPAQQALSTERYVTQEWPLLIRSNTSSPENNPENMSAVYLQLSTADNGDPILFFEYGNAISATTENNYAEGSDLLETFEITAISPGTNTLTVSGAPAGLAAGDDFYVIGADDKSTNAVYRLVSRNANAVTPANTDLVVEAGTLSHNPAAGAELGRMHFNRWTKVVGVSHPNHPTTANPNQKLHVAHVIKLRYFRQMHETGKAITAIDQAGKRITLSGVIPRLLVPGDRIVLMNSSTGNNGSYTIAAGGVAQVGSNTQLTLVENIPAAYSAAAGVNNGLVKIKPTRVPASGHYADHKFGSLNAITRQFKILSIVVSSASQSVITIAGDYRHIIGMNTRLSIVKASVAANNGSYVINGAPVMSGANTQITITTSSSLNNSVSATPDVDMISVLALPWRSDQPTQWLAGFDFRYLDAKRQLTDAAGAAKDGFAYMGQTGVAIEQSRVIFFMSPLSFFRTPADAYSPNVINMNGGTSSEQSFWKLMQIQNQSLVLNATMLRINPGPVLIPVFDFIDESSDAAGDDPAKSNFLSLCITRDEFQRLKDLADTQLNNLHDLYIVLRREQQLTDLNGVAYRRFELAVSGFTRKSDNSLVAHEAFPSTPVVVYSLKEDAVVFTSKDFADVENTEAVRKSYEETQRTGNQAATVYAANPTIQVHVNNFTSDLNLLSHDMPAIEALIQSRAQTLWNLALSSADAAGLKPYDDRQLYWARLHARNAVREHAALKLQFRRRKEMMQLFEERSRGFHTASYASAPAGAVRILVTGYDPFGLAGNPLRSNPSGSIALHMHGKTLVKGAKQGFVQSMIFPVRYEDFDDGLVERILSRYVSGPDKVDMIVTCSMDNDNYFNIDRFASRFRNPGHTDNENEPGGDPKYYRIVDGSPKATGMGGLPQFIESNLPASNMDDTVGNTRPAGSSAQIAVFDQSWKGTENNLPKQNQFEWDPDKAGYNPANAEPAPGAAVKASYGSGGDYLSNEIFYRVALMRSLATGAAARTGHLHVPSIQGAGDFSQADTATLVQNAKTIITDALSAF